MKDKSKRLTVVNTDKKKADENASHILQQKPASALNAAGFNPALYLLKSVWDSVFEIKTDVSGQKYLFGKLPMVTQYGVTMYGDNDELNLPSIYEGLPIDNVTLYWDNGVLKAKGGEGGGGGVADSIAWANVYGKPSWITDTKPIYNYSEIKNTPDLSVFVTGTALSNTLADYATLTYLTGELKKYVTIKDDQDIVGVKNFLNGIKISNMPIRKMQDDVIYIDANLVVRGGVTMYSDNEADIPTIKDEIGFAGYNGSVGLASFDSSQFVISSNGTVSVKGGSAGLDTAQLKEYLDSNKYTTETWVKAQGYASASSLSSLQTKVNNFLEGSDTDTIINKWKELEVFLSGLSESDNLATILSTKWTTDNNLINQWNTAYGWGDHSKVGYALKSYVDSNFVTLGTKQTITGEKNFTGGLRVNNSPSIYYDATNKYWKLEGDLLVTGGVTMYGTDEGDIPSILDSLPIASTSSAGIASFDSTYFSVNASGKVTLTSAPSGASILGSLQDVRYNVSGTTDRDVVLFKQGGTSEWTTKLLSEIGGGSIQRPLRWTGYDSGIWDGTSDGLIIIPTSLKNPNAITFTGAVSATYDGSSAVTVNVPTAGGDIDLSGYLPLSGGTLRGQLTIGLAAAVPLVLQNTSATNSYIDFKANGWSTTKTGGVGIIREPYLGNEVTLLACGDPRILVSERGGVYYQVGYNTETFPILHSGNYSNYALPLSGGTLTDAISITANKRALLNLSDTTEAGAYMTFNAGKYQTVVGQNTGVGTVIDTTGGAVGSSLHLRNDGTIRFRVGTQTDNTANIIWHSGNDGSSSGLDADLLDGKHYSDIVNGNVASATKATQDSNGNVIATTYLPLGGGTLKGDIFMKGYSVVFGGSTTATRNLYLHSAVTGELNIYDGNTYTILHSGNYSSYALPKSGGTINGNLTVNGYAYFGDKPSDLPTDIKFHVNDKARFNSTLYIDSLESNNYANPYRKFRLLADSVSKAIYLQAGVWDGSKLNGTFYITGIDSTDLNFMIVRSSITRFEHYGSEDGWIHLTGNGKNVTAQSFGISGSYMNAGLTFYNYITNTVGMQLSKSNNLLVTGGITMYSDIRKKTILNHVELSLKQIADAPIIEHYYNSDENKTTHVGSIAQYWANLNDWFCKLDNEGYYTMEIQNCALASAISIARHLEKYESKTDKKIRQLKKRISQLEDELELLKKGV